MSDLVATLYIGDEDEAEVLDSVTDGLEVTATLLDYSAGGNPTYRFEGSDADMALIRERACVDES